MAVQQAGRPSRQQKMHRLPSWLRYVFIGLGLVSLGLLGYFWIRGVNNDTLNKDMTALFIVLTAMFAFLAMPPLYRSEHSQPSVEPSPPDSPDSSLTLLTQGRDEPLANRAILLKELADTTPGVFQLVISYLNISASNLSGNSASPAIRAEEVLTLVGNGHLQRVRDALNWATGANIVEDARPVIKPQTPEAHEQKPDTANPYLEGPLPNTLRGCVVKAQSNARQAYNLLNPEMNILPEDISDAKQHLQITKGDIEHLKKLLLEHTPLPEYGSIIDQVRIITEQINQYLIPHLKPSESPGKGFQKRFEPLLCALKELDTLIPE